MSTINLPSPSELHAFRKIAIEAAQVGGEILQKYSKAGFAIEWVAHCTWPLRFALPQTIRGESGLALAKGYIP